MSDTDIAAAAAGKDRFHVIQQAVGRLRPGATDHVLPERGGMWVVLDHGASPQEELGSGRTQLQAWIAALKGLEGDDHA